MQLKKQRIQRNLGLITANLFLATHGYAQEVNGANSKSDANQGPLVDQPVNELGSATIDTSILFYQERNDRVRAREPVTRLAVTSDNGSVFSARIGYDALTGASPNGAAPWTSAQTFTTPAPAVTTASTTTTVTSASGNRTLVTIPGTTTTVAQYQTPANVLPVDKGFRDQRTAYQLGYDAKWSSNTNASISYSNSTETDYLSHSLSVSLTHAMDHHNSTVSLGYNVELDRSSPIYGTPKPMTEMNGDNTGISDNKRVGSWMLGITQVINRRWLMQVNYNVGWSKGYQTDPYRIISVVNATTGAPVKYLYEGRPRTRARRSLYIANKVAIGPTAADISFRFYRDSWGIRSFTSGLSERIPVFSRFYIEPNVRFYHQNAAKFFHYYLLDGQPQPYYASADGRLAKFNARTVGIRLGYDITRNAEIYLMAEDYKQSGDHKLPNAPGALANLDFFSGVHARSYVAGFKYRFKLFNDYSGN